jgi:hypothetical protein
MRVGTIVRLKVDCLGNKHGAVGMVYYDYGNGSQVIFQNGNYNGFSETRRMKQVKPPTEKEYFLEEIGFEPSLANYQFKSVLQVEEDFRKGVFDIVFKKEW